MQNCNNCFKCTQCHQNGHRKNSQWCSLQKRGTQYRNQSQRCKQMKKLMSPKHVTIQSSSQTNCTKSITDRLQKNKQRSHRPPRSTRQKQTYKFFSLTNNSEVSNCTQQPNTETQCKSGLSGNSCKQRNQAKRIAENLQKKQNPKPNSSSFSAFFRKCCPCPRQTICFFQHFSIIPLSKNNGSVTLKTPF